MAWIWGQGLRWAPVYTEQYWRSLGKPLKSRNQVFNTSLFSEWSGKGSEMVALHTVGSRPRCLFSTTLYSTCKLQSYRTVWLNLKMFLTFFFVFFLQWWIWGYYLVFLICNIFLLFTYFLNIFFLFFNLWYLGIYYDCIFKVYKPGNILNCFQKPAACVGLIWN